MKLNSYKIELNIIENNRCIEKGFCSYKAMVRFIQVNMDEGLSYYHRIKGSRTIHQYHASIDESKQGE
jgi:hypothetical protein